ncbi:MAG: sulfotransferase family protein [Moorea sp. SIO4A3]|nr:sulfotransferase family protein [Moorena sp. SIO4A3]
MNNKSLETSETQVKLVVLWTAPRCVSTAFEKAFSQRPDTATLHEPFQDIYYCSQWRRSDRMGNYEKHLDYGTNHVIERIQSQSLPVVFMKEMAYHALPYIDREFMNQPLVNTFLVRNPKKSLLSWYKLNEFPTEEEFGFNGLKELWQFVTEKLNQKPIVVEADRLQSAPEKTLRAYCQAVGIAFVPEMLNWNEGRIKQENSHKEEIHSRWHQTLVNSMGILPPTEASGEIRSEDIPMFQRAMKTYEEISQFAIK